MRGYKYGKCPCIFHDIVRWGAADKSKVADARLTLRRSRGISFILCRKETYDMENQTIHDHETSR